MLAASPRCSDIRILLLSRCNIHLFPGWEDVRVLAHKPASLVHARRRQYPVDLIPAWGTRPSPLAHRPASMVKVKGLVGQGRSECDVEVVILKRSKCHATYNKPFGIAEK